MISAALLKRDNDRSKLFELLSNHDEKNFAIEFDKLSVEDVSALRDNRSGSECKTLLHHACKLGNLKVVRYLVRKGHKVDVFDTSGRLKTPLMQAIESNHIDVAAFLVEASASLAIQDIRLENALHWAARSSGRMVKAVVKASTLSPAELQSLASTTNIKLLFPEDVATFALTQENLCCLREKGHFLMKKRRPATQQIVSVN